MVCSLRHLSLDSVKRGDLITVPVQGEQGKPHPALIIRADHFQRLHSITILPMTSTLLDAPLIRVAVQPDSRNGLTRPSQIMVDKPQTPALTKLGPVFGTLDDVTMIAVNRALALFLGLA